MLNTMSNEKRSYSVEPGDDDYWPARLVIRSEVVAKFESTALAARVSKLLNEFHFPDQIKLQDMATTEEILSAGRKLLAVVDELQKLTPSGSPMLYSADADGTKLRIYTTDFGDLFATMQAPGDMLVRSFSNFEGDVWAATTHDTNDEHLTALANLASRAEWAYDARFSSE